VKEPGSLNQPAPEQRPWRPPLKAKKCKSNEPPLLSWENPSRATFFEKPGASRCLTIFTNARPAPFTGNMFEQPPRRPIVEWENLRRSKPQNEPETADCLGF
jgi:hypothetical protein